MRTLNKMSLEKFERWYRRYIHERSLQIQFKKKKHFEQYPSVHIRITATYQLQRDLLGNIT